ncbi:WD40 repeat domain-containing protein [Tenggerimyces flavus]|uniref:WD40 repeat domain-containing protein n=1 Tax=Tenggerimyces flavus TaxID=1708749 RepID=A0ABV7YH06_9ACTN|nr:hypothetical protein [Tenggerimyces flavus]MBM7785963.1 hypothetical protein [Tenggerimyces flavus]
MTEAEDLLRGALHRVADGVRAEPVPHAIVRRAHRRRSRRRVGFAAAGAALVTAAVPFGASFVRAPLPTHGTATDQPVASGSTAAAPGPVSIDFDKLSRGPEPAVAYYANGVIRDGGKAISFRDYKYVGELAKVASGYAVVAAHDVDGMRELILVGADGSRRPMGKGVFHRPAISADGRTMAWSSFYEVDGETTTTLYLADTASGTIVRTLSLGTGDDKLAVPRAIDGKTVIVERATNALSKPVQAWDTSTNELTAWYDAYGLAGMSADGSLAAVGRASSQDPEICFDLVAVPDKRRLWQSCDYDHWAVAFAPDSKHLLSARVRHELVEMEDWPAVPTSKPGGGTPTPMVPTPDRNYTASIDLYVLDASTGKRVLQIKGQQPLQRTWESSDTFLFTAVDGKRTAIVRCTLAGKCELATSPREDSTDGWSDQTLDARNG